MGRGIQGPEGQEELSAGTGTGWRCRRLLVPRAGLVVGLGLCAVPGSGSISCSDVAGFS